MMVGAGVAWGATTLVIKGTTLRTAPPRRCSPISSRSRSRCWRSAAAAMGERMTAMPSAWSLGWLAYQTFWVVSLTFAVWFAMVQRYSASRFRPSPS
jgi:hypothetical protein